MVKHEYLIGGGSAVLTSSNSGGRLDVVAVVVNLLFLSVVLSWHLFNGLRHGVVSGEGLSGLGNCQSGTVTVCLTSLTPVPVLRCFGLQHCHGDGVSGWVMLQKVPWGGRCSLIWGLVRTASIVMPPVLLKPRAELHFGGGSLGVEESDQGLVGFRVLAMCGGPACQATNRHDAFGS